MNDEGRQKLAHVWLARATRLLHPGWGGGTPPQYPLLYSPFPTSSLHHLALSRSARLLTTCASAGPALAPGLIVHW